MLIRFTTFLCAFYVISGTNFVLSEKNKKCEPCKNFTKTGTSPYEALWNLKNKLSNEVFNDVASKKMLLTSEDIKTAEGYFLEYCRSNCRHLFEEKNCEDISKVVSKNGKIFRFQSLDEEKKFTEPAKKEFRKHTNKPHKKSMKKKITETPSKKFKKMLTTPESVKTKKHEKEENYAKLYHNVLFGPRISKLENVPSNMATTLVLSTSFPEGVTKGVLNEYPLKNSSNTEKMATAIPVVMRAMKNIGTSALPFEGNQQSTISDMTSLGDLTTEEVTMTAEESTNDNDENATEMNFDKSTEDSLKLPEDNTTETGSETQEDDLTTRGNTIPNNPEKDSEDDTNYDENSETDSEDKPLNENQENSPGNEEKPEKPEKAPGKEKEPQNQSSAHESLLENIIYSLFGQYQNDDFDLGIEIVKCIIDAIFSEIENSLGLQPGVINREPCGGKNNKHLDFGIALSVKNLINQEHTPNEFGNKEILWYDMLNQNPNFNLPVEEIYRDPVIYNRGSGEEGLDFGVYPTLGYEANFDPENWSESAYDYIGPVSSDYPQLGYDDYLSPDRGQDDIRDYRGVHESASLDSGFEESTEVMFPDLSMDEEGISDSFESHSLRNVDSVDAVEDFLRWRLLSNENDEEDEEDDGYKEEIAYSALKNKEADDEEEEEISNENGEKREDGGYYFNDNKSDLSQELDSSYVDDDDFTNNIKSEYKVFKKILLKILNSEENSTSEESEEE